MLPQAPGWILTGTHSPITHCLADEAGNADYGEEAEEDEGMGLRQSSGLSHLPEMGGEEHESLRSKRRRPIKSSTRLGGKTNRRRRLDEEDEHTEEVGRLNRKRKRGGLDCITHICMPATGTLLMHPQGSINAQTCSTSVHTAALLLSVHVGNIISWAAPHLCSLAMSD